MKNLILFLALLLSVSSCTNSKNDTSKENHLVDVPVLSIDEVVAVGKSLTENISRDDLIRGSSNDNLSYATSSEVGMYLTPLISSGRVIQTDVISMISEHNWWGEFTAAEREAIRNFDEAQLAELSLIFSHCSIDATRASVAGCLTTAILGIGGGTTAYWNGTVGLIIAKTAIKILKHLEKKISWNFWCGLDCLGFCRMHERVAYET